MDVSQNSVIVHILTRAKAVPSFQLYHGPFPGTWGVRVPITIRSVITAQNSFQKALQRGS